MEKHKKKERTVKIQEDELEELKKKAAERDEFQNKWLKVHADYENTRRRLEKERLGHIKFANEGIIAQLFPIVDNFDMALDAMEKARDKAAVMDGIEMVQKQFHKILEENGVKRIETEGQEFDPHLHEAMMTVETDEYPEGYIVEEIRAGYLLNDRLLRPAQVKVAKEVSKNG